MSARETARPYGESMGPHPDLHYKRTDKAMLCQFGDRYIAFAFRMDDGHWELCPIEDERTVHETADDALERMRACCRRYAWAHTTFH